jgi:hypothetical protein
MRIPVHSSVLAAVSYNNTWRLLEVEFLSGRLYQYHGVPATTYNALLTANSTGTYFNRFIRNCFRFDDITPPQPAS